jgi:hypothetical protein
MAHFQHSDQPRPLDAAQSIGPALRYTWAMLTRPFSLRKWLALALISLVAGSFGGGGANFAPGQWPQGGRTNPAEAYLTPLVEWAKEHVLLLAGLGVLLFLLVVAAIYLAAVFRFVFLDCVARNRVATRRAFAENWDRGLALFLWNVGIVLATLAVVGAIVGAAVAVVVPLWRGNPTGGAIALIVLLIVAGALVGLALIIALALMSVTLADFVVPIMYLEGLGIWAAWGRAIRLLRSQLGPFALYYVLKMPVEIACALAAGMLSLAASVVALIPVGVLALVGVGVALAAHVVWTWTPVTIFITVFGGGLVLIYVIYAAACAALPVTVFRQAWALWFLGERDRRLATLTFPPSPGV